MDKRIIIAQRQRPFSHQPGTKTVLPGSLLPVTVYPCLLEVNGEQFPITLTGPVKDFTVMLDLEVGCVKVWGHYQEGFLRYRIHGTLSGRFSIVIEKSPKEGLFPVNDDQLYVVPAMERLFLGCNKAQDWDMVKRRMDPAEILPFWHRLGQQVPTDSTQIPSLVHAFQAHFDGIMAPRNTDTDYQGLELVQNPGALLSEGCKTIRSLFFKQQGNMMDIIHSEFHCGRMINISCGPLGMLDMEWTKRSLRRMVFHAATSAEIQFNFPKELKRFRVSLRRNQKGKNFSCGTPIVFEANQSYLLDNFEK